MSKVCGNIIGGGTTIGKSIILEASDGVQLICSVVDQEMIMTATPNDVRNGCVCATEDGVITGIKDIPAYRTRVGAQLISPGQEFSIPLRQYDGYDYTKIQGIIAVYNPDNPENSVETDKVIINDAIYPVGSTEKLSTLTKNVDTKSIDFNIINDSEKQYLIYYFTYREEE